MNNEITKVTLLMKRLGNINECKYYYRINIRFYNNERTEYRETHFIVSFKIVDMLEYFKINDNIKLKKKQTQEDYYSELVGYSFVDYIDYYTLNQYIDNLYETLKDYYKIVENIKKG